MILAPDLINEYLDALVADGDAACKDWADPQAWVARSCRALVRAGRREFPVAEGATKGMKDRYDRSEYLGLDVTLYAPTSWTPPLFVAEHEYWRDAAKVQYDAWKLLAVEAQRRMLVAYFEKGTSIPSFKKLEELVKEVCKENPGKDILLVGADAAADPKGAKELRGIHESAIVGVMPLSGASH